MDDLFQSLTSMGQGTHARNRSDGASTVLEGAVFGAAFDALSANSKTGGSIETAPEGAALSKMTRDGAAPIAGSDSPQSLPQAEVGFTAETPLPQTSPDGSAAPDPEPLTAPNIAINAQMAGAVLGAPATQHLTKLGPQTSPLAEQDPDQPQNVAPPLPGISPRLVPGAVGVVGGPLAAPHSPGVGPRFLKDHAMEQPLAQTLAGQSKLSGDPGVGLTERGLRSNTVPMAQEAGALRSSNAGAVTVPPSDRVGPQTTPQTSPTSLPIHRMAGQTQPQTIPPADPRALEARPNTSPTSLSTDPSARQIQPQSPPTSPATGGANVGSPAPFDVSPAPVAVPASHTPITRDGAALGGVGPSGRGLFDSAQTSAPPSQVRASEPTLQTAGMAPPTSATAPQTQTAPPTIFTAGASAAQVPPPHPLAQTTPPNPGNDAAQDATPPRDALPVRTGGWSIAPASQPAPFVMAPLSPASPPMTAALGALSDIASDTLPELEFAMHAPSSALATTALTPSTSVLAHAPSATAQTIAQQIAAAFSNSASNADTPLELALDPPELGRVRMQISELAGTMTLMIHAERPETADLMRRHLELLAQEFAQAGLGAPSVHISQDGAGQGGTAHGGEASTEPAARRTEPEFEGARALPQRTAAGGLDLRL